MNCSVTTLCVASVCAMVSMALVAIAFATDNWTHVLVDHQKLKEAGMEVDYTDPKVILQK